MLDQSRFHAALDKARTQLLAARVPSGHWEGWLSSSALSTATAVTALSIAEREGSVQSRPLRPLIEQGIDWLACHANPDGGWGDTTRSISNISTTTLCWAAFAAVKGSEDVYRQVVARAAGWLTGQAGGISPDQLAPAIIARYGKDRTFSVPILTTCALAGRLGEGPEAWKHVIPLPFELAAFPPQLFAALRLPVVSYALPALIAIGQAHHHHAPSRNPFARLTRNLTSERTLRVLEKIQPTSGGFLEATPLTSFVVMSLAGSGHADHPAVRKGVEFLIASVREDGSWPIDTNLATWVTTLSVNALSSGSAGTSSGHSVILDWLLHQQYRVVHPYTNAAPGGWAWTDLPGGVPDADDTAGALLAVKHLSVAAVRDRGTDSVTLAERYRDEGRVLEAAAAGVRWLLDLQNSDGGIPTFCRGWTNLPFDRSSPDLTAHAIRAWLAWQGELPMKLQPRVEKAVRRALEYLAATQRSDGSWIPLWFGNQHEHDDENPTYGTAKVVLALADAYEAHRARVKPMLRKALEWLAGQQQPGGGWSGSRNGPASTEETALAVDALATALPAMKGTLLEQQWQDALEGGAEWLIQRVESDVWTTPAPIGFYFAKLWYYERLYPLIFTVGALERMAGRGLSR